MASEIVFSVNRHLGDQESIKRVIREISLSGYRAFVSTRELGSIVSVMNIKTPLSHHQIQAIPELLPAEDWKSVREPSESDSSGDARTRATELGAPPGRALSKSAATKVLERIAANAMDLFSSSERALAYLEKRTFAGDSGSALDLIEKGAAASVIGGLDELRFGSQG